MIGVILEFLSAGSEVSPAVDVTCRDLCAQNVIILNRHLSTGIRTTVQPIEASTIEIDDENFSTGFPIKAHISVGLFDNTIRLACDDVPVFGYTHIHTLATREAPA